MKRREFLKSSALSALVVTGGCKTLLPPRGERVVVIGAGMAGITAARRLQEAGYEVTVLEAADRIGGRIHTDRSMGAPVNLGAARILGVQGNPIIPLAEAAYAEMSEVDWDNLVGFEQDGTEFDAESLSTIRGEVVAMLRIAYLKRMLRRSDISVETALQREIPDRFLTPSGRRLLNFGLASVEVVAGGPLDQLSLKNGNDYKAYEGGNQFLHTGYDAIIRNHARGVRIETGVPVTGIDYERDPVRVETDHGTLRADRVVVTVSLGVLQAGTIRFNPGLPIEKLDSIDRSGMGTFNKVVLRFPERFWPAHPYALAYGSDTRGEYPAFLNLFRYTGEPILVCLVPWSYENALENLSDVEAIGGAVHALRDMYGSRVPDPTAALRTRWHSDPWVRGAFSYNKFGASGSDRDAIAEPVADRVFFAGEATQRNKYGSVNGAYHSGERVAEEIIRTTARAFT